MADNLKILIESILDEQKTISNINTQLKNIATKIDKLKIDVDISGITKATKDMQKEQLKIEKTMKNSQLSGEGYDDLQERLNQIRNSTDKYAKATIKTYENTKNLKSATIEYTDSLGRLVKEEMKWTEFVDKQNKTKNKVFKTTGFTFVDDVQKANKEINKLNKSYEELAKVGRLSSKELQNFKSMIDGIENVDDIEKAKNKFKELSQTQKELLEYDERLIKLEEQKRNEIRQTAQEQAKYQNKAIEAEQKLGEKMGSFDALKEKNITEEHLRQVLQLNEAYRDREIRAISLDRTTGRWSVTLKESSNMERVLKGQIDRTNGSLYKQSDALRTASASNKGFAEQLKIALQRVPIWVAAMTLYYGSLRSFQQGLQQIVEIDSALVNLAKVTQTTKEELNSFALEANNIGNALGKTTSEVIQATTEYSRLGYSLSQAKILAQESLLYSNVGDIDVETANENIISAIKGFRVEVDEEGKNIRKIIDLYNEVGNNFAITSAGIGEAMKRASSSLYEAGNDYYQAVAMVTAANAAVQDPEKVGTALKTVAMRIRGIDDAGQKVVGLVPQLEESFNNIGLTLKKNDNTFKSTYEIMNELASVWSDLEDFDRANILEQVAG